MLTKYFRSLYQSTMREAYDLAFGEIIISKDDGGKCLDCGCYNGHYYDRVYKHFSLSKEDYYEIEWDKDLVAAATDKGLNVIQRDLNAELPFDDHVFQCVYGLSVLEHLLRGCHWIKESKRVLKPNGSLVILTPNISTIFIMALLAVGTMPSSGPHPDYLAAADIFVGPSKGAEGEGLTFIEAMRAGTPVVCGGIVDAVRHEETGLLVVAGAPERIAEAIRRLARDPALAARLVRNGSDLVAREFARERTARAYSSVICARPSLESPKLAALV